MFKENGYGQGPWPRSSDAIKLVQIVGEDDFKAFFQPRAVRRGRQPTNGWNRHRPPCGKMRQARIQRNRGAESSRRRMGKESVEKTDRSDPSSRTTSESERRNSGCNHNGCRGESKREEMEGDHTACGCTYQIIIRDCGDSTHSSNTYTPPLCLIAPFSLLLLLLPHPDQILRVQSILLLH